MSGVKMRKLCGAVVHILLFVLLAYSLTSYGFTRAGAFFSSGHKIGCVMLAAIFAGLSRLAERFIMKGYDLTETVVKKLEARKRKIETDIEILNATQEADERAENGPAADETAADELTADDMIGHGMIGDNDDSD